MGRGPRPPRPPVGPGARPAGGAAAFPKPQGRVRGAGPLCAQQTPGAPRLHAHRGACLLVRSTHARAATAALAPDPPLLPPTPAPASGLSTSLPTALFPLAAGPGASPSRPSAALAARFSAQGAQGLGIRAVQPPPRSQRPSLELSPVRRLCWAGKPWAVAGAPMDAVPTGTEHRPPTHTQGRGR